MTLDIFLPDIAGWRVLERLKYEMSSRHIPVCVISTEEQADRALRAGAHSFIAKPVQSKDVLEELVEGLKGAASATSSAVLLIGKEVEEITKLHEHLKSTEGIETTIAETGKAALALLRNQRFDCVVVHAAAALVSPDMLVKTVRQTHAGRPRVHDGLRRWRALERGVRTRRPYRLPVAPRALARAPARPDAAMPASPGRLAAGGAAGHPRGDLPVGPVAERQAGA